VSVTSTGPASTFFRLGVVGDVHACDGRLELVLDALEAAGCERVVCVGDLATGPGSPDRCGRLLADRDVPRVRGNHDRWLLEGVRVGHQGHTAAELEAATVDFIRGLPGSARLEAADGTVVLLCHGPADNDMNGITADDYGSALRANDDLRQLLAGTRGRLLVVKGHWHRPTVWTIGAITLIDAGSLLEEAATGGVIVDLAARTVTMLEVRDDGVAEAGTVTLVR
jgi:predicted phosphodiesterase